MFFVALLPKKQSLVQNIDRLFFQRNAILRIEFDELFNALFRHADRYITVAKILSNNKEGLKRSEIGKMADLDGKMLTQVLKNLERCDFIIRYNQLGNKIKDAVYRLSDFYTLFYFKYVEANNSFDEQWWSRNFQTHSVESWQGQTFELICMLHTDEIKNKLGISGISTNIATWRYKPKDTDDKGAQIDMVIERADRVINLCEIKFAIGQYQIKNTYAEYLRNRAELFRSKTNTTFSIVQTMITTFGIAENMHSHIIQQAICMDDLFAPK